MDAIGVGVPIQIQVEGGRTVAATLIQEVSEVDLGVIGNNFICSVSTTPWLSSSGGYLHQVIA